MSQDDSESFPTFSVISVYNNEDVLSTWLDASLESQRGVTFERIMVDNTDGAYSSAASALNYGASKAAGKYYAFIHQDVRLLEPDWLLRCKMYLESLSDLGIAGVAGMTTEGSDHESRARNLIYHGPRRKPWIDKPNLSISEPTPVQTLDELLLTVPSDVFDKHSFDSNLCSGWHLYGVEYCLRINERTSMETYVLPLPVWHASEGENEHGWFDTDYFKTLYRLSKEYDDLEEIHTTMGSWPTSRIFALKQWGRYAVRPYVPNRLL